jgi:hypothetical protein
VSNGQAEDDQGQSGGGFKTRYNIGTERKTPPDAVCQNGDREEDGTEDSEYFGAKQGGDHDQTGAERCGEHLSVSEAGGLADMNKAAE